jgi:hypothetical protein
MLRDRVAREQEWNEWMIERRRPAPRMARRPFALAVAAERQETWHMVSERLGAKGGL